MKNLTRPEGRKQSRLGLRPDPVGTESQPTKMLSGVLCLLIVGATILGGARSVGTAGEGAKRRPEVIVVYYPHWHSYDHGSAWKGEGWTEWEGVKAAVPRFPGHEQPLRPTWGYFDESDPQWSAREIDLAADHGIDVFFLMQAHRDHWQQMTTSAPLVNVPVVTTGWDVTPRCAKDVPWPFPVAPTSGKHECT